MILSHRWKFIFIKGQKVAGTSVEIALSRICGADDIITPIIPIDEVKRLDGGRTCQNYSSDRDREHVYVAELRRQWSEGRCDIALPQDRFYNHMSLRELHRLVAADLSDYKIFCVERSPYSKILSWLNNIINWDAFMRGEQVRTEAALMRHFISHYFAMGTISHARNIELYRDESGRVAATALRCARLSEDFRIFLMALGVQAPPELPHAKKGFLADAVDPREFFTRQHLDQINDVFDEEFRTFGYEKL